MKITTNNVPRLLIDACQLTTNERKEFDYLDWKAIDAGCDGATFFRYKGQLHDLGEFERSNIPGWDGQRADTFFSAVVVRYVPDDNDYVVVGLAFAE